MPSPVEVYGRGLAAACCASLLQADSTPFIIAGRSVERRDMDILLSPSSIHLLAELFPQGDLFRSLPVVRSRHVLWGSQDAVTTLPHAAAVASEGELLPALWSQVQGVEGGASPEAWRILTQREDSATSRQADVTTRTASICRVELASAAASEVCWMESVPSGWLFLFCLGKGDAALVAVGDSADSLLEHSRLVAAQIEHLGAASKPVQCAARMATHLSGERWLACGNAAMTFDPVCGEGAGNAVREAILASATVRALLRGEDGNRLRRYYDARMKLGFLRHLQMCHDFYATGGTGVFWQDAVSDVQREMQALKATVNASDASLYRLNGFDLEAVDAPPGHI